MATGPVNESEHAVTNDIPEPIGYTANGQFAASLTVLHNSKQAQRTHLSAWTQINRRQVDGDIYAEALASPAPSRMQTDQIQLPQLRTHANIQGGAAAARRKTEGILSRTGAFKAGLRTLETVFAGENEAFSRSSSTASHQAVFHSISDQAIA